MAEYTQTPTKVTIPVEVHYEEVVQVPRCRKDRWRENAVVTEVDLDSYTGDQAPVALLAKYCDKGYTGPFVEPYRLVNGKLYLQVSEWCRYIDNSDSLGRSQSRPDSCTALLYETNKSLRLAEPEELCFEPRPVSSDLKCVDNEWGTYKIDPYDLEKNLASLADEIESFVLIDGALWREAPEPAYYFYWSGLTPDINQGFHQREHYDMAASEWDKVKERMTRRSAEEVDFGRVDCIEILIPEAVAMPTGNERDVLKTLAEAINDLRRVRERIRERDGASELLGLGHPDEAPSFTEQTVETAYASLEERLYDALEKIELRRQRGTVKLTDEELRAAVDDSYSRLMEGKDLSRF